MKSSLAYPNGLTATWTYDANNQLLQVCNATPTNTISQYDYAYDAGGRRVEVSKSGSAFAQDDTIAYGYNEKSELTNAVAAVDAAYRYSYDFDDIGNRETSSERGANSVYAANNLNQYTAMTDVAATHPSSDIATQCSLRSGDISSSQTFQPQFDEDGNQTLIKTSTGIWSVTYNGENRPVLWRQGDVSLAMSYDRMGRRVKVVKLEGQSISRRQLFSYNGYLQIQRRIHDMSTMPQFKHYVWDPTEPIAARPLAWSRPSSVLYYVFDGNKDVSDVINLDCIADANYEYAPFGAVTASAGACALINPWRFSSEYADDLIAIVHYNFRDFNPANGRWVSRDRMSDFACYCFLSNGIDSFDFLGDDDGKDPSWKKSEKLKDLKDITKSGPSPQILKTVVLRSEIGLADPLGRLDPPPPHSFAVRAECAYGRYYKVFCGTK